MSKTTTFEIYSFKNGDWMIDSVHDDKQMALHQARMLIESPHHMAIRVLQEIYDDETDKSMSLVVFKQQKGEEKRKKGAEKQKKAATSAKKKKNGKSGSGATKNKPKKKKKSSFTRTIVLMALALGGVGLGLIAIIGALISAFNN